MYTLAFDAREATDLDSAPSEAADLHRIYLDDYEWLMKRGCDGPLMEALRRALARTATEGSEYAD